MNVETYLELNDDKVKAIYDKHSVITDLKTQQLIERHPEEREFILDYDDEQSNKCVDCYVDIGKLIASAKCIDNVT